MKRLLVFACLFVLVASCVGLAQAVAPNSEPAPGVVPNSVCYPTCVMPTDIVAADFNQNGWLELAVSCSLTGQVLHYADTQLGTFAPPGGAAIPGAGLSAIPLATYLIAATAGTYDGFPDLLVVGAPTPVGPLTTVKVLSASAPAGAWAGAITPVPSPTAPSAVRQIAAGNMNNDNRTDFVYVTTTPGLEVQVVLSAPGGAYVVPPVTGWPGLTPVAVATADFNQDGKDDVAVVDSSGGIHILFAGAWTWLGGAQASTIPSPAAIAAGDFNGDGFPDIVVVGNDNNTDTGNGFAEVFLNQLHQVPLPGGLGFTPLAAGAMRTWGFAAKDVAVFDADGNGRDDFAVANWGSATVTVFLSNALAAIPDTRPNSRPAPATAPWPCLSTGDQTPERLGIDFRLFKYELRCGFHPIALAPGDFDNNGKQDLAVALQSADKELCAQNPSCIEVIFDAACGFISPPLNGVPGQQPYSGGGSTSCPNCKAEEQGKGTPPPL